MPTRGREKLSLGQRHWKTCDDVARRRHWLQPPRPCGGKGGKADSGRSPDPARSPRAGWSRRHHRCGASAGPRNPLQLQPDVVRGLEARAGVLGETGLNQVIEGRRNPRHDRADCRRLLADDGPKQARLGLALEGPAAGQHLEEHRAEREDVRPRAGFLAFDLLRRHVLQRAEHGPACRQRSRCGDCHGHRVPGQACRGLSLRQPEVEQLDRCVLVRMSRASRRPSLRTQEDVAGLQVAMNDPVPVGAVERGGDLRGDLERARHGNGPSGEPVSQRLTLKVFEDEEMDGLRSGRRAGACPMSCSVQMFGCESCEMLLASRSNRSRNSKSLESCGGSTLIATVRSRRVSLAL